MGRVFWLILLTVVLLLSGCAEQPNREEIRFSSYHDIPGITQEQIQAIGQLREQHEYFIYGMLQNDETFLTIDGEIVGFSAELCGWLTELFGIPFVPVIFDELPELMAAIESGNVHFTGQLPYAVAGFLGFAATDPISMRSVAIARIPGSRPFSEIKQERNLRLAFSAGSAIPGVLYNMNVFDEFETVLADTPEHAVEILNSGEADAFLGDGVLMLSIDFPNFSVEPFYPFI